MAQNLEKHFALLGRTTTAKTTDMNLKSTLLTATALGVLTLSAHAQMAGDAMPNSPYGTPNIPGMVPGTTPGFVTPANGTMPMPNSMQGGAMPTNSMPSGMMQSGAMPDSQMMNGMMMSAQDQLFAARAAEGNLAEITLARLALNKTKNANVRQTAQVILMGHTQAQNELMQLMRAKNMTMMPMLSATHMAAYDALQKAKGDNFDKMYMAGQTDDHENTIALFASETNAGMDDALKGYANKNLPDIVGHTILIYNVAKQVKAPGSELRPMLPPVPPGVTPALMGKPIDMTNYTTISNDINAMLRDMNAGQMNTNRM